MTTTATTGTDVTATSAHGHRRTAALAGLATYALGAAFTIPYAHDTSEIVTVLGGASVVAVIVYGWVVPRGLATGSPGTALALSAIAALLLLPAFWSMLPLVLGVAGVMLGRSSAGFAPKRSYAAIGLGAITVAGYLCLYLVLGLLMGDL